MHGFHHQFCECNKYVLHALTNHVSKNSLAQMHMMITYMIILYAHDDYTWKLFDSSVDVISFSVPVSLDRNGKSLAKLMTSSPTPSQVDTAFHKSKVAGTDLVPSKEHATQRPHPSATPSQVDITINSVPNSSSSDFTEHTTQRQNFTTQSGNE